MNLFRTGPFLVDPFHFELRRSSRRVALEPRVMEVLVHLLDRPGEVVTKEELLRDVWDGKHVGDEVVAVAIYQIRKALGDRASCPAFVETVHRRGYRFIAGVERLPGVTARRAGSFGRASTRGIAAGLVSALALLSLLWLPPQAPPAAPPSEAQALYQRGRYFLDRRKRVSLSRARESFAKALALAPDFAAAYAGLADVMSLQADMGFARPAEVADRAQALAERALALDGESAEAWTSVALVHFLLRFDLEHGESALRRAIELGPDLPFPHQVYAWLLSADGHLEQAVGEARRAALLAPTGVSPRLDWGFILSLAGRDDDAVGVVEQALEHDESQLGGYATLGWAHARAGRPRRAMPLFAPFWSDPGSETPT